MKHTEPKITVLMPAYNAGRYIREAIASVLAQSFADFELLIVNDGSTDDTLAVIQTFNDIRIRVISHENRGIASALNTGLALAHAPYIARFDADDICYPDRLRIQYDFMISNPEYSIVGSAANYVDVSGAHVFHYTPEAFTSSAIRQLGYKVCPFIHSTVLYRREAILQAGGYNENAYTFEDHFLWAHILKEKKGYNLRQSLIKVRLNPGSVTIDEKWRTPRFRKLKYKALRELRISDAEGRELMQIGKEQHSARIKEGAYYALLGKKYLWNNYQPEKARKNLAKALTISPLHIKNLFLLLLSFLPESALVSFYNTVKANDKPEKPGFPDTLPVGKELNYDR